MLLSTAQLGGAGTQLPPTGAHVSGTGSWEQVPAAGWHRALGALPQAHLAVPTPEDIPGQERPKGHLVPATSLLEEWTQLRALLQPVTAGRRDCDAGSRGAHSICCFSSAWYDASVGAAAGSQSHDGWDQNPSGPAE